MSQKCTEMINDTIRTCIMDHNSMFGFLNGCGYLLLGSFLALSFVATTPLRNLFICKRIPKSSDVGPKLTIRLTLSKKNAKFYTQKKAYATSRIGYHFKGIMVSFGEGQNQSSESSINVRLKRSRLHSEQNGILTMTWTWSHDGIKLVWGVVM